MSKPIVAIVGRPNVGKSTDRFGENPDGQFHRGYPEYQPQDRGAGRTVPQARSGYL